VDISDTFLDDKSLHSDEVHTKAIDHISKDKDVPQEYSIVLHTCDDHKIVWICTVYRILRHLPSWSTLHRASPCPYVHIYTLQRWTMDMVDKVLCDREVDSNEETKGGHNEEV